MPASAPRRLRRLLALVPAVLVAGSTLVAAPAHAGTYDIRQCRGAGDEPLGITPGFITAFTMTANDGCAAPKGTYAVTANGNTIAPFGSEWQAGGVQIAVPSSMPNTLLTKIDIRLSVAPKNGDTTLSYGKVVSFVPDASGVLWGPDIPIPAGYWGGFFDTPYARSAPNAGARSLITAVQCYGPCDFQSAPTMIYTPTAITLSESVPPAPASVDGVGLFDGTTQRGLRALRFSVADADSGVARVELRDEAGKLVSTLIDGNECSYTRPAPCPQTRSNVATLVDTAKLPEGPQKPQLWTYDVAGNVAKQVLGAVDVDNVPGVVTPSISTPGQPGGPNGFGGDTQSGRVVMKAGTDKRTANLGAKVSMKAQLVDAAGVPIRGGKIDVYERVVAAGAAQRLATTLTTGDDGRFTYNPPTGASREIRFAYASVTGSTDYRMGLTALLTVRAKVQFHISASKARPGRSVTFSGKLVVDPLPTRAVRVVIESRRLSGKGWLTAATLRVRKGGIFRWSHRFQIRSTYTMRARVLGSSDLPARPTASRTRRIRVR